MMERPRRQVRFAILCMGRSGSTMLQTMLDSHPDIRCFGELFHAGGDFGTSHRADPAAYLEGILGAESASAVGFKMPWDSLMVYPDIWDVFHQQGFRVILLIRRNRLDQYLSMKLAIHNAMWHSYDGKGRYYPNERLYIDPAECLQNLEYFRFGDAMMRAASRTLQRVEIEYGQLADPGELARVLAFLGVEPRPLISGVERLRQGSQRDIIENYDELKASLQGTTWEADFEDDVAGADSRPEPRPAPAMLGGNDNMETPTVVQPVAPPPEATMPMPTLWVRWRKLLMSFLMLLMAAGIFLTWRFLPRRRAVQPGPTRSHGVPEG